MFAARELEKTYIALVHGRLAKDNITIKLPIGRDLVRRNRMTTRRSAESEGVRSAVSHVKVLGRIHSPLYGDFLLSRVSIETGRTHQIRVHLRPSATRRRRHPSTVPRTIGQPESILSLDQTSFTLPVWPLLTPKPARPLPSKPNLPVQLTQFWPLFAPNKPQFE
jgi:23S rRNA pseudouridine1911/1915/1917 synthase